MSKEEPTCPECKRALRERCRRDPDKFTCCGRVWIVDGELPRPKTITDKDPKKAAGDAKCPLHLNPPAASAQQAEALAFGAKKYGEWNWRESEGVLMTVYIGALKRHIDDFMLGENVASDSKVSHLGHIMAGCAIMLDAQSVGKLIDDRPPNPTLPEE